jgi:hypothetical protein
MISQPEKAAYYSVLTMGHGEGGSKRVSERIGGFQGKG